MKYEKYLIKKNKLDLLSSLKALDKKIIDEKLKEYDLESIKELKKYIIEDFEMCLDMSKDDTFTQMYFQRLLEHENSKWMSAYEDDIESLLVFVYENGDHYSYYIPTEIKDIIKTMLKEMTTEAQINLQNAANTPIIKDLKGLLNTLVVKDLRYIGGLFHINRLSNKPKKELVNIIYNALTDKDKLSDVIERFNDKEFSLLKELILNQGTIQNNNISMEQYHFLYMLGIVFLFKRNNKFYISITDDVYNVLTKINLDTFEKIIEENTKIYNLVRSMVELYGVVSYGELNYAYNSYFGHDEDFDIPNNVLYFCDRVDNIEQFHTEHNLFFVNRILNNKKLESIIDDIIDRQHKIEKKPIELDELLKYNDYNYYENNPSKNKFKKYLERKNLSDEIIEEIIITISKMYRLGNTFIGAALEMLQEYGIEITEKNMQEILNYLTDIYNNTRIWTNNGWTPIEMRKKYK
jgi:hypothetical protein